MFPADNLWHPVMGWSILGLEHAGALFRARSRRCGGSRLVLGAAIEPILVCPQPVEADMRPSEGMPLLTQTGSRVKTESSLRSSIRGNCRCVLVPDWCGAPAELCGGANERWRKKEHWQENTQAALLSRLRGYHKLRFID